MSSNDGHVFSDSSCIKTNTSRDETLMISRADSRGSGSSPGARVSPVATRGEQRKAAPRERWLAAKTVQHYFGGCSRDSGSSATPSGSGSSVYNKTRIRSGKETTHVGRDVEIAGEPIDSTPDDSSVQQSEKDLRMWSALKTSLLSEGLAPVDRPFDGVHATDDQTRQEAGYMQDARDGASGCTTNIPPFDDQPGTKGTRNMEQLDLERSAMDRSMRPHRSASARLLETEPSRPSPSRVDRTFKEP